MSLRDKLDARRLLNGAAIAAAIAVAWAIERRNKPPPLETYSAGWAADPDAHPRSAPVWRMPWPWWRAVLIEIYEAMNKDRLIAVAAGVVFYALLAIVPAITALVSSYSLFADAGAIKKDLSLLANVLPPGGIAVIEEQIVRSAPRSGYDVDVAVDHRRAAWRAD